MKIIWCRDFDSVGPLSGLCSQGGKNYYFFRNEKIISLYNLDEAQFLKLQNEHEKYCQITGGSLIWGQSQNFKQYRVQQKPDEPISFEEDEISKSEIPFVFFQYENHLTEIIIPENLDSNIKISDVENFYVPHEVVM